MATYYETLSIPDMDTFIRRGQQNGDIPCDATETLKITLYIAFLREETKRFQAITKSIQEAREQREKERLAPIADKLFYLQKERDLSIMLNDLEGLRYCKEDYMRLERKSYVTLSDEILSCNEGIRNINSLRKT